VGQMAWALIQPFGTLWFIYLLAIFLIVTRLVKDLPPIAVWLVAAALQIALIDTGIGIIDHFAAMYVYFYTGHILSGHLFRLADAAVQNRLFSWTAIGAWALLNGAPVWLGWAMLPVISLALGLAGAWAIVAFSALIATTMLGRMFALPGAHSIAVYLAFFLPMAATRIILTKTGLIPDVGLASFIVMTVAVIAPLVLFFAVRNTPLKVLFERPAWARIIPPGSSGRKPGAPLAAEPAR
jgi:uncharacterized membrane protein YcfT